jgi:hypothetical protein
MGSVATVDRGAIEMRDKKPVHGRIRRCAIPAAMGIALFTIVSCTRSAAPLWEPVPWAGAIVPTPQVIRSQAVKINIRLLRAPFSARISLVLPGGRTVTAIRRAFHDVDKQQYIWRGTIEGNVGSVVTFSVVNDKVSGDIVTSQGEMYRVRYAAPHVHVIEQLDPSKFPPEERLLRRLRGVLAPENDGKPVPAANGNTGIDVMVLYTPAAETFTNGTDSVISIINQAVDDANVSYADSGVNQAIHKVYAGKFAYSEKADIGQDLGFLKIDAQVQGLRCLHQADIVVLITGPTLSTGSCGAAYEMHDVSTAYREFAFAVVPANCATGIYSFAHELGHVMGADHNDATGTDNPPYPYSRGYESPNKTWYTIMANRTTTCTKNSCSPRILHWSNPLISYLSVPTGVSEAAANPANNALALNNTASTVASFYPSSADCPAVQVPLPPDGTSVR